MTDTTADDSLFWELAEPLLATGQAEEGTMMGFKCLRTDGAFFATLEHRSGDLVVKTAASRVEDRTIAARPLQRGDDVGFATGAMLTSLDTWRDLIDDEATGAPLAKAITALVAETGAEVAGADYKRVPKPYPADHPRGELLRHKWLQVRWPEPTPANVEEAAFAPWCAQRLTKCAGVHRWLVENL